MDRSVLSVPKVFGLENEYGIQAIGHEARGSTADADGGLQRIRRVPRTGTLESLAGDIVDQVRIQSDGWHKVGALRAFLSNGGHIYRDSGSHPEYATPECVRPLDLVAADRAGDLAFGKAIETLADPDFLQRKYPVIQELHLYKNNLDSNGNAFGTHENYALDAGLTNDTLEAHFLPFLATRPLIAGSGGVVADLRSRRGYRFVLSPRSLVMEAEFGNRTTSDRPMFNLKNEPLADPRRYRRAHLLCGDATRCEVSTFLKVGTTAIVLAMIEDGFWPGPRTSNADGVLSPVLLESSLTSLRRVVRDPSGRKPIRRINGTSIRPLDVQYHYLIAAQAYAAETGLERCGGDAAKDVLGRWERVLHAIDTQDFDGLFGVLDWATRYALFARDAERRLDAGESRHNILMKARHIDLRFAELHPESLFERLTARGQVERLLDHEPALTDPGPAETRAFIRGEAVRRWPDAIHSMNWDHIAIDHHLGPIDINLPEPWLPDHAEITRLAESEHERFLTALGAASPYRLLELARINMDVCMLDAVLGEALALGTANRDDPRVREIAHEVGRSAIRGLQREIQTVRDARTEMYIVLAKRAYTAAGLPGVLLEDLRTAHGELQDAQAVLETGAPGAATQDNPDVYDTAATQWRRNVRAMEVLDAAMQSIAKDPRWSRAQRSGRDGVGN